MMNQPIHKVQMCPNEEQLH